MSKAPELNIPPSTNTVDVSIINTAHTILGLPTSIFYGPKISGHDIIAAPVYSFLIQHPTLDRTIVFDLGIRKDWQNYSPVMTKSIDPDHVTIRVPKTVRQILDDGGVDTAKVESVVWSHWHLDHCGSPAEWPVTTSLIVGPGFENGLLPGYPTNSESPILESDLADRRLIELSFPSDFNIGAMEALDYFSDGSLYFLNSPGHTIGHISALARVTSNPDSFILMGGDAWHHSAELRPSPYLPLPEQISPHPFTNYPTSPCPGALFASILRDGDNTKSFYEPRGPGVLVHYDQEEATRTIEKLQEVDPRDDVLMAAAHDESLLDVVDFFPKKANGFMEKGWVKQARWKFLMDFAKAVGWEGEVKGLRDWSTPKER
ncbi:hypothetical protein DOTSEDRAFT_75539 [Dothistroma septosporum NZE10]|uniref:Uncharacterized protein n=1 Tax=Dothistroma septosporum (strain NZE10 / CBS 128990) TaxID=675120 RepID=M2XHC7_DOTSN|nr:hypothetical protein DOTSEDRAFT_75539 [Dothistroma septosporum NZE10]